MILRLLFIFSLSFLGSSERNAIEKEKCKTETACYIRKSCFDSSTVVADEKMLVRYKDETLKGDACDVFLQARPFSDSKYHIMMQVNSSTDPISPEGVALIQGTEQFRCKDGEETTGNGKLKITSFGDRRIFELNFIFCSFIIQTKDPDEEIVGLFKQNYELPGIIFTAGQQQSIEYEGDTNILWKDVETARACNPDHIITSDNNSNDSYILEKVQVDTFSTITCPTLRSLQIKRSSSGRTDYPDELSCNKAKKRWRYKIFSGDQMETVIVGVSQGVQETIEVHCVIKKCLLCQPLEHFDCGGGCSSVKYNNTPGHCAKATCPNNLWRLPPNEKAAVEGEVECKHKVSSSNPRESIWYMTHKTGGTEAEIAKASCAQDANCQEISKLIEGSCPPRQRSNIYCGALNKANEDKQISCWDSKHQLRYDTGEGTLDAVNLTCSIVTGIYSDEQGRVVPKESTVYCEIVEPQSTDPPPSAASAFSISTNTIIGIGVGTVCLLLVIGIVATPIVLFYIRKKRFAKVEKLRKQEEKRVADTAALQRVLVPDCVVERKMLPDREKTPWELRKRFLRSNLEPDDELLNNFNDDKFVTILCMRFREYTVNSRIAILVNLTAFTAYNPSEPEEDAEFKSQGNLNMFFTLWRQCHKDYLDCPVTWEYMWRFMRILYESYAPHDDHKETAKKMVKMVTDWARFILYELSFKIRRDEDDCDTLLRVIAIKMLIWSEAPDVLAEMTRLADLPLSELESPLRAVVIAYGARHLGRAEELKAKYWEIVEIDNPEGLTFGTIRHHILYGLCAARDESKKDTPDEFKVLREVLTAVLSYEKVNRPSRSFVPLDQLWAFRGAAEYVSNWKPAVETFSNFAPEDPMMTIEKLMMWRCNQSKAAMELMRPLWKPHIIAIFNLVCEMCTMKKQFDEAACIANIWNTYVYIPAEIREVLKPFNIARLGERASNLYNLISDRKVATIFHEAMEDIKHKPEPYARR